MKAAKESDLAVYSSHIPVDLHPRFGNNPLLARELRLETDGTFGRYRGVEIGVMGACDLPTAEIVGHDDDPLTFDAVQREFERAPAPGEPQRAPD